MDLIGLSKYVSLFRAFPADQWPKDVLWQVMLTDDDRTKRDFFTADKTVTRSQAQDLWALRFPAKYLVNRNNRAVVPEYEVISGFLLKCTYKSAVKVAETLFNNGTIYKALFPKQIAYG